MYLCRLPRELVDELVKYFDYSHVLLSNLELFSRYDLITKRVDNICLHAARDGHLKVLQWAVQEKYPCYFSECTNMAVKMGHLELAKWMFHYTDGWSSGCRYELDMGLATRSGNLELLKWVWDTDWMHRPKWGEIIGGIAAEMGRIDVLEWMKTSCVVWMDRVTTEAARHGQMKVLKWAWKNHIRMDERTVACAASGGHMCILKWLRLPVGRHRRPRCPWNATACSSAAASGQLDVLKWLREQGCPWDASACSWSCSKGHLEVLKWLREQGCPWFKHSCVGNAHANGHIEVARWVETQLG